MGLLNWAGKSTLKTLDNGIIVLPEPRFTAIAACRPATGEYFVTEDKRWHPDFTATVQKYQTKGELPLLQENRVRIVHVDEISSLYGEEVMDIVEEVSDSDDVQQKLHRILDDAARARASDLKIYQRSNKTIIRAKIAGQEFNLGRPLTVNEGENIISILFDRRDDGAGDPSSVNTAFQSFAITPGKGFRMPLGVIKLRGQKGFHETGIGTGLHLILRLFYSDSVQQETATITSLGFDDGVLKGLARARRSLKGAIIIGGATGDGKSTTLSRCLSEQYREHEGHISIVTVEDPVEYKMMADGILQIPIITAGTPEERQLAYRKALMHFVRINPDVGSISEIRDQEAAKEVLQFVDTGHQVWTTIHVNSANGILFRLIDMGIQPSELAKPDAISLLMKQTLVPVLCAECAMPFRELPENANPVEITGAGNSTFTGVFAEDINQIRFRKRDGCSNCISVDQGKTAQLAWAGYDRQLAVAEIIEPDEKYLAFVRNSDMIGAKRHWLSSREKGGLGGLTIGQKIERMIREGLVDPNDAIRKGWEPQIGQSPPGGSERVPDQRTKGNSISEESNNHPGDGKGKKILALAGHENRKAIG